MKKIRTPQVQVKFPGSYKKRVHFVISAIIHFIITCCIKVSLDVPV